MSSSLSHPYARMRPNMRVREGAPVPQRPTKEEIENFPRDAANLLAYIASCQDAMRANPYDVSWTADRHFLIAGGSGTGIGGALSVALLNCLSSRGSLTMVARDLTPKGLHPPKRKVSPESGDTAISRLGLMVSRTGAVRGVSFTCPRKHLSFPLPAPALLWALRGLFATSTSVTTSAMQSTSALIR